MIVKGPKTGFDTRRSPVARPRRGGSGFVRAPAGRHLGGVASRNA